MSKIKQTVIIIFTFTCMLLFIAYMMMGLFNAYSNINIITQYICQEAHTKGYRIESCEKGGE